MNNDTKDVKKLSIYSLTYAHIITYIILIYCIIIPVINKMGINDKTLDLFKSYYIDNKFKHLIIDFFVIYFIIKTSEKLPFKLPPLYNRILVIIIFDLLLTIYINKSPYQTGTIKFLKEWSLTVGWFAILWDLFYINIVGKVADKINSYNINQNYHLIIMGSIMFFIMHI